MASRVLVLLFHPQWEKSRVNKRLMAAIPPGVTQRDLYQDYPDFDIDVVAEQERLNDHDVIVFHHPFFWYSCPPLMKQYLDLVFQHGWAYGSQGRALEGKRWLQVVTTGGPEQSYQPGVGNGHTVDEFLVPFEQTAKLCRMIWLAPFAVQGTHLMTDSVLETHAERYRERLNELAHGQEEP